MLLAMLHEINVESAESGPPGPNAESGVTPYRSKM
ncbi:MAG: hypothetical protein QOE09_3767, partial [Ilumatobacteraceae bacterium]